MEAASPTSVTITPIAAESISHVRFHQGAGAGTGFAGTGLRAGELGRFFDRGIGKAVGEIRTTQASTRTPNDNGR